MPFTFSHPAIVLPLTYLPNRWYSLTGLVIGSMAPDFEYFIRLKIQSTYSHTIAGLFWFNVPLGLLLAFIFHGIVRNRLIDNLPYCLQSRFSQFQTFNWMMHFKKQWMVILLSLLLGAASHICWDGFTHKDGFFVKELSVLDTNLDFGGTKIYLPKILQHTSTLIGGLAIVYAVLKLPKNRRIKACSGFKYWTYVVGLTLAISAIRVLSGFDYEKPLGHLIATGIGAGCLALIITSGFMFKSNHK